MLNKLAGYLARACDGPVRRIVQDSVLRESLIDTVRLVSVKEHEGPWDPILHQTRYRKPAFERVHVCSTVEDGHVQDEQGY